jgi:tetratricopeptide (TPR) repeat protein
MLPVPQCPNPECPPGSVKTGTGRIFVRYGESGFKRLLSSWLAGLMLTIALSALAFALIRIVFILLSEIANLAGGIWNWVLALLIIAGVAQGVAKLQSSLAQITVHNHQCRRCKYRWFVRDLSPATSEQYARWAAGELASARARGDQAKIAIFAIDVGGHKLLYQGDCAQSQKLLSEALDILRPDGASTQLGYALNNLGFTAIYCGESIDPLPLLQESITIFRKHKEWNGLGHALNSLGEAMLHAQETELAMPLFEEALSLALKLGTAESIEWALRGLAMVAGASGQPLRAARLFGAAEAMRAAFEIPTMELARPFLEGRVVAARQQASAADWELAWAEGRAMPPQQAVEYALEPVPSS